MPATTTKQAAPKTNAKGSNAGFETVESGKKDRKKKEKVKRVAWGVRDEKGKLKEKIKGAVMPADFSPKTHLPLRKMDFENPADYLNVTADRLEAKAKKLRADAIEEAKLGSVTDRKKAKRAKGLIDKFKALYGEMKESGTDEAALRAFLEGAGLQMKS